VSFLSYRYDAPIQPDDRCTATQAQSAREYRHADPDSDCRLGRFLKRASNARSCFIKRSASLDPSQISIKHQPYACNAPPYLGYRNHHRSFGSRSPHGDAGTSANVWRAHGEQSISFFTCNLAVDPKVSPNDKIAISCATRFSLSLSNNP
jgi:hypothetical protein